SCILTILELPTLFPYTTLFRSVPSKKNGGDWLTFPISEVDPERFPVFSHGLGAGDINGDGLTDVLEKSGWWEQPKNWDRSTLWKDRKSTRLNSSHVKNSYAVFC